MGLSWANHAIWWNVAIKCMLNYFNTIFSLSNRKFSSQSKRLNFTRLHSLRSNVWSFKHLHCLTSMYMFMSGCSILFSWFDSWWGKYREIPWNGNCRTSSFRRISKRKQKGFRSLPCNSSNIEVRHCHISLLTTYWSFHYKIQIIHIRWEALNNLFEEQLLLWFVITHS